MKSAGGAFGGWHGLNSYIMHSPRSGHVEDMADYFETREAVITNEVYTFRRLTYREIAG